MTYSQVVSHEDRLARLIRLAEGPDLGEEVQAQLARYICVLLSGYLEESLRQILGDYANRCCSKRVAHFVQTELRDFQNPKADKVVLLLRKFDGTWADDLEKSIEGKIKDAVDSIVANRHLIAHGRDVGLSLGKVAAWFPSAKALIAEVNAKLSA